MVHEVLVLSIFKLDVACGWVQSSFGNLKKTWLNVPVEDVQDDDMEVQKSPTLMFTSYAPQIDLLLQRYSSWSHLLRVMSWALRFLKRVRRETPEYLTSSTLKLVELQQASREIVRLLQRQHFREEYLCLKEGRRADE